MTKIRPYIFNALFLGLSLTDLAIGQTTAPSNAPPATNNTENNLSLILNVIDQVGTLIPGIGLNSIRIGDPITRVIENLGKPHAVDKKKRLLYQLDDKTRFTFSGKKTIKLLSVTGLKGSLAHVNNGITFGQSSTQVISKFNRKPSQANKDRVRYKSKGIEFQFERGILRTVLIFAPK